MIKHSLWPLAVGGAMGLMMLWMAHDRLMGESQGSILALALFAGAHVAALAAAVLLPIAAAPRLRSALSRLHRPNPRHVLLMLTGAGMSAGLTHLILHGGAL